ncbi:MAG: hypothetical protein ACLVJX_10740, partial [Merdibacter sp.]
MVRILQAVLARLIFAISSSFLHSSVFEVGRYGEQTKIFFGAVAAALFTVSAPTAAASGSVAGSPP